MNLCVHRLWGWGYYLLREMTIQICIFVMMLIVVVGCYETDNVLCKIAVSRVGGGCEVGSNRVPVRLCCLRRPSAYLITAMLSYSLI